MLTELWDEPFAGSALASDYVNTIRADEELSYPGDEELEDRILDIVRWHAAAMVVRANAASPGIGGHFSQQTASRIAADLHGAR